MIANDHVTAKTLTVSFGLRMVWEKEFLAPLPVSDIPLWRITYEVYEVDGHFYHWATYHEAPLLEERLVVGPTCSTT